MVTKTAPVSTRVNGNGHANGAAIGEKLVAAPAGPGSGS